MKKEIIKKSKNEENFTFLPVENLTNISVETRKLPRGAPLHSSHSLSYRNYDINYIINFCHILIGEIDKHKMHPKDLAFTLTHSLRKMLAHLEVEKDQIPQ
jgi:hypothetical protein